MSACFVRRWFVFVVFVLFCFPGVLPFPCGPSLACPPSLSLFLHIFCLNTPFLGASPAFYLETAPGRSLLLVVSLGVFVTWPGLPDREPLGAVGGRGGGFILLPGRCEPGSEPPGVVGERGKFPLPGRWKHGTLSASRRS